MGYAYAPVTVVTAMAETEGRQKALQAAIGARRYTHTGTPRARPVRGTTRRHGAAACAGLLARRGPDSVEQLKHGHAQRVGNDLYRIERRICVAVLDAAQVGLIKAALLAKFDLAHPGVSAQFSHTLPKSFRQAGCHSPELSVLCFYSHKH